MTMHERSKQESPRDFKQLAIHVLVEKGFIVFQNIAANETVDAVVALSKPEDKKLNLAAIRIKTGSLLENGWYFSEETATYSAENSPFFYIFCAEKREQQADRLFPECWFIIVSPKELMRKTSTFRNGNYAFNISENQLSGPVGDPFWKPHINQFEQIAKALT
jgi:hypothetical protein